MSAITNCSPADLCRRREWVVGDVLEGAEGGSVCRIQITAIGEVELLAKIIWPKRHPESLWSLRFRDWKKVGGVEP